MAITNGYATLAEMRSWLGITDVADTGFDSIIESAVEAASRAIDHETGRFFYSVVSSARTYLADDPRDLRVHDFQSVTAVSVDENNDGVFELSWASTDWQVYPANPVNGRPFTRLEAIDRYLFPVGGFRRNIQVTGTWGWSAVPKPVNQACKIHAARLFKRKDSVSGVLGLDGMGATVRLSAGDSDVLSLIAPFRRLDFPS